MSNDLTTTPSSTPARPISPALSPELTRLLDSAGNPDVVLAEILGSAALIEEARAVLPALRDVATMKAGEDGVKAVVGRRFGLYPQPVRSEAEWAVWWADYFDVLSDVPLASLEAAMRAHVGLPDSEFMPKPGRLRELAFLTPCRSLGRYQRAMRAVQVADQPLAPPVERADPTSIRRMLEEFNGKIRTTKGRPPQLPSIAGQADDGGITPQMRALMARRAEEGRA